MKLEDRNPRSLSRREFNGLCAALGASLPVNVMIAALSKSALAAAGRTVKLPDGTVVPALGQGSWHLAQGRHPDAVEEEALRTGLSLGMTLLDTAEVYSSGRSEQLMGRVIAGQRERVYLVSKVPPQHTAGNGVARACQASLARLGTDHLDLYLLHWRGGENLAGVVAAFEALRAEGKIRAWGVSNFNLRDMEELFRVPHGDRCATNQVLYNLGSRGIEKNLLPWCGERGMPIMAYTPLGSGLVRDPVLARIGAAHGCSAAAVALAWAIRGGNVIAIPESGSPEHVKENAAALSLTLTEQELQTLDAAHPCGGC
jgi:diketogulonate reductase-like aldo/keto reductase